jgi:hypothetical protein
VSTDKTLLPSIFFIEFFLAAKLFFTGCIRSLHFVRVIPFASREAIRSVTHQVLAPDRRLFLFFSLKAVFLFPSFGPAPNSVFRVQKTFSAGPCSFSFQDQWFLGRRGRTSPTS